VYLYNAPVEKLIALDNNIFLLKARCPEIASVIEPGQFLNVRVSDNIFPLLRRPFSICDVEGKSIYLMFNILGEGTRLLAKKHVGDIIDILGPLGHGFNINGEYETAIIVAGGLGAAPFPYLVRKIGNNKIIKCFVGGKSSHDVIQYGMKNIQTATENGSLGFRGDVIELLDAKLSAEDYSNVKVFACGPNAMLRALKEFTIKHNIECEASTECAMACGFGICMGCSIEEIKQKDKYLLVCKDGPVFNVRDVVL
jgi:dihydroorotate dehydrogenase electron transfer subunit